MTFSQGCINANSAGGYGLYTTNGVTALGNWWGSSSGPNRTGTSNGTRDALYGTAVYVPYATNAIACGVTTPTATPTVTRTPTLTRTPTRTPTPTATPLPRCDMSSVPDVTDLVVQGDIGQSAFYNQPFVYESGRLFTVGYTPLAPGVESDLLVYEVANRPWLWPSGIIPATPPSLDIFRIDIIGYLGVVPWVSPTIEWVQIQIYLQINQVPYSQLLYGYMNVRDLLPNCSYTSLPFLRESLPSVSLDRFAGVTPVAIFDNFQSPATMGSFGRHYGFDPSRGDGATIDVVPRNIELCIDTSNAANLNLCDPPIGVTSPRIPIYAPVQSCAIYLDVEDNPATTNIDENQPPTIYLRIDNTQNCSAGANNGNRIIALSHVVQPTVPSNNRILVNAGQLLGYMCLSTEAFSSSCEVRTATTPTHLAYQTQYYNGAVVEQAINDVQGMLVRPYCLYDNWFYSPGNPQLQTTPVQGCPN